MKLWAVVGGSLLILGAILFLAAFFVVGWGLRGAKAGVDRIRFGQQSAPANS